jgi:hypothetical protein
MTEIVDIPISDLLLDGGNPRLENEQPGQQEVANGPTPIAPGMSTFNQYVHNPYTHPKAPEMFAAWDELQPLMEKLWP